MWFSRPSHNNREAWELRLLAQTQYALFETFEADETEEERDEVKLEMEARLRDYVAKSNHGIDMAFHLISKAGVSNLCK